MRRTLVRAALLGSLGFGAAACAAILGIDEGTDRPEADAGADATIDVTADTFHAPDVVAADASDAADAPADGACSTTIRGTVYAPNGTLPVYDALVYATSTPGALPALTHGASCDTCGVRGDGGTGALPGAPTAVTSSAADGTFSLQIPASQTSTTLVIQLGKWRRQVPLSNLTACGVNEVTASLSRLPKNHAEGDMPHIAVVTGCEMDECLLRNLGIDDAEISSPAGSGAIHLYPGSLPADGGSTHVGTTGSPASSSDMATLFASPSLLASYDMVLLACLCGVPATTNATNLGTYAAAGGRLLVEHYGASLLQAVPSLAPVATFAAGNGPTVADPAAGTVATASPTGVAFDGWLGAAGVTTHPNVSLTTVRDTVLSVGDAATPLITARGSDGGAYVLQLASPAPPQPKACGYLHFSDYHALQFGGVTTPGPFPSECPATPPPQGDALAFDFTLFDLLACH